MTYDQWKTDQPYHDEEPMPPPTPEEEAAEAWEHWHQRSIKLEQENHELKAEVARLRAILIEAHNFWRHDFSTGVEAVTDKLFKALSASNTDPFARRTAIKDNNSGET